MVNTPDSLLLCGGDLVQLRQTSRALRDLGVDVSESFDAAPDARGYDLVHIFNLRTIRATRRQVSVLSRSGVPIAMSPIYLNPSYALWGSAAVWEIFGHSRDANERECQLRDFARRTLCATTSAGVMFSARQQNRPWAGYDDTQREILRAVDHLLPNSVLEMTALMQTLGVTEIPFTVVPYAADAAVFLDADPEPFRRRFGCSDFVLQAGRIERSKNQLMLSYALRDGCVPLVFVGKEAQPQYAVACRHYGPSRLLMMSHLTQRELASAYAAARVHVLPSWVETCGLVTMEAALAGCTVVVSTAGYESEYYGASPYYCMPEDCMSIRRAVLTAYDNYSRDAVRRDALRRRIVEQYTWERAAQITLCAYEQIVGRCPWTKGTLAVRPSSR